MSAIVLNYSPSDCYGTSCFYEVQIKRHQYTRQRQVLMFSASCLRSVPRMAASDTHSMHGNADVNHLPQGLRGFQSNIFFKEVWPKRPKLSRTLDVPTVRILLGLILQKWYVRRWIVKQILRFIFHSTSVCCQLFLLRICIYVCICRFYVVYL